MTCAHTHTSDPGSQWPRWHSPPAGCGGGDPSSASQIESTSAGATTRLLDPCPSVVPQWDQIATDTLNSAVPALGTTAEEKRPLWPIDLVKVHLAMSERRGDRTYPPVYAVEPMPPADGASIDAAVGAAAFGAQGAC